MDRMAADITDSAEATMEDVEEVDAKAEDKDCLLKRHKTQTYLQSADNPHHFLGGGGGGEGTLQYPPNPTKRFNN